MTEPGLRERKKARTRQVIADAAARLFAQRGYEQVAVSDVAREAEVSEQTVYNYFQTKEQLVTDRDQLIQDELSRLIRTRAPGTTPAAAIREYVLEHRRGNPPHSRRTVARRARLPGRYQPYRPPARPGDVRPPGRRPRHRPRRDRHSGTRDRKTPGNRAQPASSTSSSPRPDTVPARARARTRSPTSCGQPSKRSSTTSTPGFPQPRTRTTETARPRLKAPHHLSRPGRQKALPKANHREKLPGQAARDRGTPAFRTGEFRPRRQRPGPASGRGGCVPQPSRPRCTGSWRPLPAVRPLPGPVSWDCWKGRLVPRPRALTRSRSG